MDHIELIDLGFMYLYFLDPVFILAMSIVSLPYPSWFTSLMDCGGGVVSSSLLIEIFRISTFLWISLYISLFFYALIGFSTAFDCSDLTTSISLFSRLFSSFNWSITFSRFFRS